MEGFWIPLLTILTFLHQTASAGDTTEVIRAVGESVTFRSHNADGYSALYGYTALWRFGDEPIAMIHPVNPHDPIFYQEKYRTRVAFSEQGHALTIFQVGLEDAGTYCVRTDGEISTFKLQVYRELEEPRVTCEAQKCSAGSCLLVLRCSVPGDNFGKVSYSWRVRGQPQDDGSVVLLEHKSSQDEPEPLTCTARNAISSRNVTVTTPEVLCSAVAQDAEGSSDPCPWSLPSPGNSTDPAGLPEEASVNGGGIGLTAGFGVTGPLLVSLVFLLFFC